MKSLCFLGLLAFFALANTSPALSIPPQELLPGADSPNRTNRTADGKIPPGLTFEMSAEESPTGDLRFTARLRFPFSFSVEDFVFALNDMTVEVTEHSAHWGVSRVRTLTAQQDGDVVTCIFIVSKKDLEDPLLSFSFYQIPRDVVPAPPFTRFARLSKYLPNGK